MAEGSFWTIECRGVGSKVGSKEQSEGPGKAKVERSLMEGNLTCTGQSMPERLGKGSPQANEDGRNACQRSLTSSPGATWLSKACILETCNVSEGSVPLAASSKMEHQ